MTRRAKLHIYLFQLVIALGIPTSSPAMSEDEAYVRAKAPTLQLSELLRAEEANRVAYELLILGDLLDRAGVKDAAEALLEDGQLASGGFLDHRISRPMHDLFVIQWRGARGRFEDFEARAALRAKLLQSISSGQSIAIAEALDALGESDAVWFAPNPSSSIPIREILNVARIHDPLSRVPTLRTMESHLPAERLADLWLAAGKDLRDQHHFAEARFLLEAYFSDSMGTYPAAQELLHTIPTLEFLAKTGRGISESALIIVPASWLGHLAEKALVSQLLIRAGSNVGLTARLAIGAAGLATNTAVFTAGTSALRTPLEGSRAWSRYREEFLRNLLAFSAMRGIWAAAKIGGEALTPITPYAPAIANFTGHGLATLTFAGLTRLERALSGQTEEAPSFWEDWAVAIRDYFEIVAGGALAGSFASTVIHQPEPSSQVLALAAGAENFVFARGIESPTALLSPRSRHLRLVRASSEPPRKPPELLLGPNGDYIIEWQLNEKGTGFSRERQRDGKSDSIAVREAHTLAKSASVGEPVTLENRRWHRFKQLGNLLPQGYPDQNVLFDRERLTLRLEDGTEMEILRPWPTLKSLTTREAIEAAHSGDFSSQIVRDLERSWQKGRPYGQPLLTNTVFRRFRVRREGGESEIHDAALEGLNVADPTLPEPVTEIDRMPESRIRDDVRRLTKLEYYLALLGVEGGHWTSLKIEEIPFLPQFERLVPPHPDADARAAARLRIKGTLADLIARKAFGSRATKQQLFLARARANYILRNDQVTVVPYASGNTHGLLPWLELRLELQATQWTSQDMSKIFELSAEAGAKAKDPDLSQGPMKFMEEVQVADPVFPKKGEKVRRSRFRLQPTIDRDALAQQLSKDREVGPAEEFKQRYGSPFEEMYKRILNTRIGYPEFTRRQNAIFQIFRSSTDSIESITEEVEVPTETSHRFERLLTAASTLRLPELMPFWTWVGGVATGRNPGTTLGRLIDFDRNTSIGAANLLVETFRTHREADLNSILTRRTDLVRPRFERYPARTPEDHFPSGALLEYYLTLSPNQGTLEPMRESLEIRSLTWYGREIGPLQKVVTRPFQTRTGLRHRKSSIWDDRSDPHATIRIELGPYGDRVAQRYADTLKEIDSNWISRFDLPLRLPQFDAAGSDLPHGLLRLVEPSLSGPSVHVSAAGTIAETTIPPAAREALQKIIQRPDIRAKIAELYPSEDRSFVLTLASTEENQPAVWHLRPR